MKKATWYGPSLTYRIHFLPSSIIDLDVFVFPSDLQYADTCGKDVGALNLAKLIESQQPCKQSRILDVACGNGLAALQVRGLDREGPADNSLFKK